MRWRLLSISVAFTTTVYKVVHSPVVQHTLSHAMLHGMRRRSGGVAMKILCFLDFNSGNYFFLLFAVFFFLAHSFRSSAALDRRLAPDRFYFPFCYLKCVLGNWLAR